MKALFNNFNDLFWIDIKKKLINHGVVPSIIIDDKSYLNESKKIFDNCIHLETTESILFENENNKNYFNDKKILDHRIFYTHKKIAYDLLNRFSKDEDGFDEKEFTTKYNNSILFWFNFLKDNKIDIFFSKHPPHLFYDYTIYLCCKILKIKTIFFCPNYLHSRLFLGYEIKDRSKIFFNKIFNNINKIPSDNLVQEFMDKIKLDYSKAKPYYIKRGEFLKDNYLKYFLYYTIKIIFNSFRLDFLKKNFYCLKEKNRSLRLINKLEYNFLEFSLVLKKKKLFSYYKKNSTKFDKSKKFIYFAAMYQPELTNSPYGGYFHDHIKALKVLNDSLPDNYFIYYKEHPVIFNPKPQMFGNLKRNLDYYSQIKKMKKVKMVNIDTNTFELIDNSQAVCTISGQIGVEAILRKKPCIVFSRTWYSKLNGIFLIKSSNRLKKIFNEIISCQNFDNSKEFFIDYFSKSIEVKEIIDGSNNLSEEKKILITNYIINFLLAFNKKL